MGDPRRIGKKYTPPNHPWIKARIDEAKELKKEFGVRNRKEILKMESVLKSFTKQAKRLAIITTKQEEKERDQLFARLSRLGLMSVDSKLDDVLGLTIKDIMQRRLQTILVKKGLAHSVKQARQFITHRHIVVNNHIVTSPSYIVTAAEEDTIFFDQNSSLANPDHPERTLKKDVKESKTEEEKSESKEKKDDKKDTKKDNASEKKEEVKEAKEESKENNHESKESSAKEESKTEDQSNQSNNQPKEDKEEKSE